MALLVLALTLAGHIIGMKFLYAAFPIYDIPMHIIGGIGIALFVSALINSKVIKVKNKKRAIIIIVFMVGIVWELFEIRYDIAGYPLWTKAYYLDTLKDLLDDVIGASLVAWLSL